VTILEGSHLFPLENPRAAAAAVQHWLTSFEAGAVSERSGAKARL
jgi:hypothetical protein